MINVLKLHDTKNIFLITIVLQVSILSLFFLDNLGINLVIFQELISIIYLLFIPGFLILRFLKLNEIDSIESILYSLGLSISVLMFIGLAINLIYPILGIKNPLSFESLFLTINGFTVIVLILTFKKTRSLNKSSFFEKDIFKYPIFYFLMILPFISIIGAYIMNILGINTLLLVLILLISLIPIIVAWDKFIPPSLYGYAIFMISISLLLHNSLISFNLWGWDIQQEYYLSNLVIMGGSWNHQIPDLYNSVLSIVMLAPVLSIFSGINLTWIYKIIYPFIFAFVPLGLYKIFKGQTNSKIAFLGAFFFMSFFVFYQEMLQVARQEIAELFLVLLLLLILNNDINKMKKAILLLIFGSALVVSHYGLSYIFIGMMLGAWIFTDILQRRTSKFPKNSLLNDRTKIISSTIVLFLIVTSISWYMYISNASSFEVVVKLISHIFGSLNEFMNPESAQGYAVITSSTKTVVGQFNKILQIAAQAFIVIGVISVIFNYMKINLKKEYLGFIIVSVLICFLAIFAPYLASSLNTSRLYQISLIFLSVFCIIGGMATLKIISRSSLSLNKSLKIMSLFLTIFLLLNTGFVNQIFNEPVSISLTNNVDYPKFSQNEAFGANWLFINSNHENNSYADDFRNQLLQSYFGSSVRTLDYLNVLPDNSYLYLGNLNIQNNTLAIRVRNGVSHDISYNDPHVFINRSNEIYDNSGSEIFYRSK